MDLAIDVTCDNPLDWHQGSWQMDKSAHLETPSKYKVVAMDFGCKHNILRSLEDAGCAVHVVPANATADEIMALQPDGVFLSNGPGDPAATAAYAGPQIAKLIDQNMPVFGICIGHQLMALGAWCQNPSKWTVVIAVPIIRSKTLPLARSRSPARIMVLWSIRTACLPHWKCRIFRFLTNRSKGCVHTSKPAFCVQYHPESSPGPHDSRYLFERFTDLMEKTRA
jgi:carbamoyl-phosphate synthase small subunit